MGLHFCQWCWGYCPNGITNAEKYRQVLIHHAIPSGKRFLSFSVSQCTLIMAVKSYLEHCKYFRLLWISAHICHLVVVVRTARSCCGKTKKLYANLPRTGRSPEAEAPNETRHHCTVFFRLSRFRASLKCATARWILLWLHRGLNHQPSGSL